MQSIGDVFKSAWLYVLGDDQGVVQKKLPVDASYVDIALSETLDAATVTKENIKIAPAIDGDVGVVDGNTIRYTFTDKPKIGDNYIISLSSAIQGSDGAKLKKNYTVELEISAAPRVIKITPEGPLEDLSQHIVVFFNVPMVPLASLTTKDTLPCPLTLQPQLAGTCHWITSSALEFVPETHFIGSTVYTATVANVPGLLYPLSGSKSVIIDTPVLNLSTEDRFDPAQWILLSFNFSLDKQALEKHLSLSENGAKLWYTIKNVSGSDSQFLVSSTSKFFYIHNYQIDISEGLMSTQGNKAMGPFSKTIMANNFLQGVQVAKNIYSETWAILETRWYRQANEAGITIANKGVFFNVMFDQEVPLNA